MSSHLERSSSSSYQDTEDSHSSYSSAEIAEPDQNSLRRDDLVWVSEYWETRS